MKRSSGRVSKTRMDKPELKPSLETWIIWQKDRHRNIYFLTIIMNQYLLKVELHWKLVKFSLIICLLKQKPLLCEYNSFRYILGWKRRDIQEWHYLRSLKLQQDQKVDLVTTWKIINTILTFLCIYFSFISYYKYIHSNIEGFIIFSEEKYLN